MLHASTMRRIRRDFGLLTVTSLPSFVMVLPSHYNSNTVMFDYLQLVSLTVNIRKAGNQHNTSVAIYNIHTLSSARERDVCDNIWRKP
jgi:hypothetical protein